MLLKCGTFNLYQFAAPPTFWYDEENFYSDRDWISKTDWIKSQLNNMNCDIVGFQEVFSPNELKELVAEVGYNYFAVVDEPHVSDADSSICVSSIVAIASKFPLNSVSPVKFHHNQRNTKHISTKFSRVPIKAKLLIEGVGEILIYVAHLKSKNSKPRYSNISENASWVDNVFEVIQLKSESYLDFVFQNLGEASAIYSNILRELHKTPSKPIILMGDLNDGLNSNSVKLLSSNSLDCADDGTVCNLLPEEGRVTMQNFRMHDVFDVATSCCGSKRTPTHCFNGKEEVLDYIFVSNALNRNNEHCYGHVVSHQVFDEHLKTRAKCNLEKSDHAQVVVTIQFN